MATSGTTDFDLDFLELAEEAWERASGGATELRSGYNLRTARRSLNLLLLDWANRGINLWTLEEGSVPLAAGQARYVVEPDTVDLMEHRVRYGTETSDLPLTRISLSNYTSLPTRGSQGRPVQIVVDRKVNGPEVVLWPVPDRDGYTLVYWRLRRMQDAGAGVQTQDVPFRMLPALTAGLAYMIAGKIPEGMARLQLLKAQYDEAWILASNEDREKASVRFVPSIGRL